MDFYVARAMQIATMSDSQIAALHSREIDRDCCLPNAAVQMMLHLPEIKSVFSIPDEPGAQASHAQRIRTELLQKKIAIDGTIEWDERGETIKAELKPWDAVSIKNVALTHAFDWRVFNAATDCTIDFAYQGGTVKKRGNLKSRVLAEVGE